MLHGNEKIYWQASPSKIAIIFTPGILIEIIVAAALIHPFITGSVGYIVNSIPLLGKIAFLAPYIPSGLVILAAIWHFLTKATLRYVFTSERLIIRYGVLVRTEDEIELYRVIDAIHTINIFQRLIGVGTVTVTASDVTGTIVMNSIYDPSRVRNGLRKLSERCKSKRGVRILE